MERYENVNLKSRDKIINGTVKKFIQTSNFGCQIIYINLYCLGMNETSRYSHEGIAIKISDENGYHTFDPIITIDILERW